MSLFGGKTLFGATTPATSAPVFGTSTPAATSTPLFGSTAAVTTSSAPATGGLFGSTPAATTTTTAAAAPLFGSTTTTSSTAGTLFGATTTKPLTGLGGGGGLFGSTGTGTTTTNAPAAGGLFGSTTSAPTQPQSLGLGGVQQKADNTAAPAGTLSANKEPVKEGDMQYANDVRTLLAAIQEQQKKNREVIEAMESSAVEFPRDSTEMLDEQRGWLNEVSGRLRAVHEVATTVGQFIHHDEMMAASTKRVGEIQGSSSSANLVDHLKKHIFETTGSYETDVCTLQSRIERIRTKIERLLAGKPALTMEELDKMFASCDSGYAFVQQRILDTATQIEETKNKMLENGYTELRNNYIPYSNGSADLKGPDFCPSQATLAYIGSCLKAPATQTTGLGLSTGGGLFGSSTGGSLFGNTATSSSTAAKPLFGGGSLFSGTSSATPAATTTNTAAGSLFSTLAQPKPATTPFASTLSNNSSSGLLFSAKK